MNWFERYGIVGTFFVTMTTMWFFCLFPDSIALLEQGNVESDLLKYIAGFLVFSFLPIGYLIVILGQWIYYRQRNIWERIHCNLWMNLSPDVKSKILQREQNDMGKELSEAEQDDEAKIEAVITYYDRVSSSLSVENNKYLSAFGTKRYDVISINRGLALSVIISCPCAIILKLFILHITHTNGLWKLWVPSVFALAPAIVIIIIAFAILKTLSHSNSILGHQIMEIAKRKLRNIKV
jgi:hypothetical protein